MVCREGLEGALEKLYNEGVYITLDEFKGRQPIKRSGFCLSVNHNDFDNPLLTRHYEAKKNGSRSVGKRVIIDFDLLTYEAALHYLFLESFNIVDRPLGLWRPLPPGVAGIKNLFRHIKIGMPVEKWFTQSRLALNQNTLKWILSTKFIFYSSRFWGRDLPVPEYVPLTQASQVVHWLVKKTREGTPAHLNTNVSSAVRVCLAAKELGLDISGTFFRLGGEPFTPTKAQIIAETGSRAFCHYSMGEIGTIGIACADPVSLDEVHLLKDKLAVVQVEKSMGSHVGTVGALFLTTLLTSCPKIMINVESGDCGVLTERSCGCSLHTAGFKQHLHTIRSYEKLTSEGMTFMGSEFLTLIEEVLPACFGGHPADYQFAEYEKGGLRKIYIIVSPRVGNINDSEIINKVLHSFRSYTVSKKMTADIWQDGQTFQVVRREPYNSSEAKIQPLHIIHNGDFIYKENK